jgi:hypothetical protein
MEKLYNSETRYSLKIFAKFKAQTFDSFGTFERVKDNRK